MNFLKKIKSDRTKLKLGNQILKGGILKKNIELGLDLTPVLLKDFSEASKSYNFLFAKSIDLAEKYFSIKNELFSKLSDKLIKSVNKNFFLKDFLVNVADKGIDRLNY